MTHRLFEYLLGKNRPGVQKRFSLRPLLVITANTGDMEIIRVMSDEVGIGILPTVWSPHIQ